MARPRKSSDSNATVSVSLRIDPKVKYAIDLLAREQNRTITGVVEWAVMQAVRAHRVDGLIGEDPDGLNLNGFLEMVWSPIESHRIVSLGVNRRSLLTFEELCHYEIVEQIPQIMKWGDLDLDTGHQSLDINYGLLNAAWPMVQERAKELMDKGSYTPIDPDELSRLKAMI